MAVIWPESSICRWRFLPGWSWGGREGHHGEDSRTHTKSRLHRLYASLLNISVLLQVRFARPESEQARQRRIQSYEFLQKKQAEEPWINLHYHSVRVGGALTFRALGPWVNVMYFPLLLVYSIGCCIVLLCTISFVFVMWFEFRMDAQSMKGSTCSASQGMPQRTLNW